MSVFNLGGDKAAILAALDRSQAVIEFKPDGDGTLLTLHHEQFFDEPARDRHNAGWTAILEKLDQYLA